MNGTNLVGEGNGKDIVWKQKYDKHPKLVVLFPTTKQENCTIKIITGRRYPAGVILNGKYWSCGIAESKQLHLFCLNIAHKLLTSKSFESLFTLLPFLQKSNRQLVHFTIHFLIPNVVSKLAFDPIDDHCAHLPYILQHRFSCEMGCLEFVDEATCVFIKTVSKTKNQQNFFIFINKIYKTYHNSTNHFLIFLSFQFFWRMFEIFAIYVARYFLIFRKSNLKNY